MKNKGWVVLVVVICAIVLLFGGSYNSLQRADENVNEKWAQVENQLQRRYDLIPQLVAVVKQYSDYEASTLESVVALRGDGTLGEEGPIVTVDKVVEKYGLDNTINTFVIVSGIKKSDGRIYGENRKFMDSVLSSPMFWEWKTDYHMRDCGLDDIHTAHINQMITELRKRSEK